MKLVLIVFMLAIAGSVFSQEGNEVFLIEKQIEHLPVLSQGNTGTCWSFATTSFFESEIIRQGGPETDLSEMFFVYHAYKNKLKNYLYFHGNNNFGEGSLSHDVLNVVREYGMATNGAYPGIKVDGKFRHRQLVDTLAVEVKAMNKKRRKDFDFSNLEKLESFLVEHIGELPETVELNNKQVSPADLPAKLHVNPEDYIELSSFSHHPYYKTFTLEVPDNWAHTLYYNLPIDELMEVMFSAVNNGYSIAWDGDTSEKFFIHKNGKADLPEEQIGKVDAILRQETFLARTTTDDHLMHIVGLSKDSQGRSCFFTKNSWGSDSNQYGGYLHMTEDYVKLKTVGIMVHKDAIPKKIRKKLSL